MNHSVADKTNNQATIQFLFFVFQRSVGINDEINVNSIQCDTLHWSFTRLSLRSHCSSYHSFPWTGRIGRTTNTKDTHWTSIRSIMDYLYRSIDHSHWISLDQTIDRNISVNGHFRTLLCQTGTRIDPIVVWNLWRLWLLMTTIY